MGSIMRPGESGNRKTNENLEKHISKNLKIRLVNCLVFLILTRMWILDAEIGKEKGGRHRNVLLEKNAEKESQGQPNS